MDAPILCEYQLTLDEYVTANKQSRRHSRGVRGLLGIYWSIALFLLLAGIVRTTNNHGFDKTSFLLLLGGVFLVVAGFFRRRMDAIMFEKMPDRNSNVRMQIFPDRLIVETAAARTETAWSRIASCKRTQDGFLLYFQPGASYWLPLHGFEQPEDIERFETLTASLEVQ